MSRSQYNTKSEQKQQDKLQIGAIKKRKIGKVLTVAKNHLTEGTITRMKQCGQYWEMATDVTEQKKRTLNSYNCKSPWCPRCRWLKARKDARRIDILMQYLEQEQDKRFIFLTLTAPNVKADKLGEEITRYNLNFQKLLKRKEVLSIVKGYIRKLEVTYNSEKYINQDMWFGNKEKHIKPHSQHYEKRGLKIGDLNPNYDTYHPHFHVLIAVNKSYFTDKRNRLRQDEWLTLWRKVMRDLTITQVDVCEVKEQAGQGREGEEEQNKAISEVAKYTAKDSDYSILEDVFKAYYLALAGRQTTTYSGLFAKANKLYKKKKLDHLKLKDNTDYLYSLFYEWKREGGEYILIDKRELTDTQKAKLKGLPIDEMEVEDNETE